MRYLGLLILLTVMTGCSGMKIEDFEGTSPAFLPEEYFLGETQAWGYFQDRFGTIRREFHVSIDGTMDGDVLVLDEKFDYRDGEQEERLWRIEKTGDGRYAGRAADVVGEATGRAMGRAVNWQYEFELPVNGSIWQVSFDDWMFLQNDRVMINRSTVSKFGIKLGEVVIFFQKPAASAGISDAASDQFQTAAE